MKFCDITDKNLEELHVLLSEIMLKMSSIRLSADSPVVSGSDISVYRSLKKSRARILTAINSLKKKDKSA